MTDFVALSHERFSCRSFSSRPVERIKIEKIIEAAIAAPTACNNQEWYVWNVTDPISQKVVRASTPCHYDAPVLLILGVRDEDAATNRMSRLTFAQIDGGIVGAHMLLAAQDLGLGALWVGNFNADAIQEAFTETSGYRLIGVFPMGYPSDGAEPHSMHFSRKKASELSMEI